MARLGRREAALGIGLIGLAAGWQVWGVRQPRLTFAAIPGAPGWRFGKAGEVSGLSGADLMTVGLEAGPAPLAPDRLDAVVHRDAGDGVPVAIFGDFFCPYCRVLTSRVAGWTGAALAVSWHELPVRGPASVLVARAAEAAGLQGGYLAYQEALYREGFRPSETYLAQVGGRAGLDEARLAQDMGGSQVTQRLADSASAAARLGIFATPGMAVRRDIVLGALEPRAFADLIAG